VPGDKVILVGDTGGRIRSFVTALGRFPAEPPWVVIGGFAVNVRISDVHRLTNDLDTISASQSELVEILSAEPDADRLDHGKVRFTGELPPVDIDVVDETGHPLSAEASDRAFALARRYAMETRESLTIVVTDGAGVSVEAAAPVASVGALVALKAVSMPRRSASNHPEKVASDAHDLVRLVEGCDIEDLTRVLRNVEPELVSWIGKTLVQWFAPDADQRYTLARIRRLTRSLDAVAIDEASLSLVALLGHALQGVRWP
jgi:hypothetical protein